MLQNIVLIFWKLGRLISKRLSFKDVDTYDHNLRQTVTKQAGMLNRFRDNSSNSSEEINRNLSYFLQALRKFI